MTSVTALLPAWNAAGFIRPTLDSLSAQTHADFRVLVSVDLCDDDTAGICEAHAAGDPRFSVIRQPQRLGYVGNCNALLEAARSDYVLFAFHDDILAPEYVARLSAALDANPGAVMSFSDMHLTHANGRREHWQLTELEGLLDPVERGRRILGGRCKWWVPNRGVFRLERARRIGGLKTHDGGEFSADWPWLFHMSLLGEFVRVPATLCHKYYKPGSLSRTWDYSPRQFFDVRCACMRELWNSGLPGVDKLKIAYPLLEALIRSRPQDAGAP